MRFEWDERKNKANFAKHGVSFELACLVFDDPLHVSRPDRHERGEERWQTMGMIGPVAVFLVVHAFTEDDGTTIVRIISARKATKHERRHYEESG